MTIAHSLWKANQDLAVACLQHPFVRGIGDGTLERDRFAYYVGQDAFFLESFLRAYSVAAAKAPDWQGVRVFHNLAAGVLEELQLHGSYARQWDVNLAGVKPGKATRQYTDFLLATAWGQAVGVTAAAMLPCMKLYGYLGQTLAAEGRPTHLYGDWIQTYSGEEFATLIQQLESLTRQYATDSTIVRDAYRYAMQCEYDFFQAAWETV